MFITQQVTWNEVQTTPFCYRGRDTSVITYDQFDEIRGYFVGKFEGVSRENKKFGFVLAGRLVATWYLPHSSTKLDPTDKEIKLVAGKHYVFELMIRSSGKLWRNAFLTNVIYDIDDHEFINLHPSE